jgi:hypothetical protein
MDMKHRVWSGSIQAFKKATARSLCIRPTNQQQYQGAGDAGKPKPESSLARAKRKVAGSIPDREDFYEAFSPQSRDND